MRENFSVASIFPFWRYAVCPSEGIAPGIPFYTYKSAAKFFEEVKRELPWAPAYLVKRVPFTKTVVLVRTWKAGLTL